MSRAKEIKEKLALQAKIQLSFSNQSNKVLNWLNGAENKDDKGSSSKETSTDSTLIQKEQMDFFKLPVMQLGSGLNMDNGIPNNNHSEQEQSRHTDIHTVGEFIKSDKKVQSLAKKKQYKLNKPHEQRTNNIHRIAKDDTKAMISLKRKLKQQNRENIKQNIINKEATNSAGNASDSDSDSDNDATKQKNTKKKVGLLFLGKKRK